jgi:hypothetical protein
MNSLLLTSQKEFGLLQKVATLKYEPLAKAKCRCKQRMQSFQERAVRKSLSLLQELTPFAAISIF